MPKIVVANGVSQGTEYEIQGPTVVGRAEDCNIIIGDRRASRRHSQFQVTPQGVTLEDLNSRNGTFVNNKPVQRVLLQPGDRIAICDTQFIYQGDAQPAPATTPQQAESAGRDFKTGGIHHTMLGARDLGGSMVSVVKDQEAPQQPGAMNVSMAADIGEMMRQSPAWADARKANERLKMMLKVATAISNLHEPKDLLPEVMNQLFSIFRQADRGFIMLRSQTNPNELEPAEIRKRNQEEGEYVEIPLSSKVLEEVVEKNRAVLTSDAQSDDRFEKQVSIMNFQIRSMMAVPLICRDETLGLIHLDSMTGARTFSEDDLTLLNIIAPQVAIAIKNAQLVGQIMAETERRASLARYLSPDLVDQIENMGISLDVGGEQKYGTVFFSDIIGFTRMSEKIGAEAVITKLNRYFHVMEETIFKHGGTIDKFQGDAIMAFWGVLAPLENAELKAVQAALEMQNALYAFNFELYREKQDQIWMGIGLNSGEFVAGNVGSEKKIEYTVIGENVNLASRIESQAARYQVFISESTLSKIRPHVSAIKFPPHALKNVGQPVVMYSVRGVLPSPDADAAAGMILSMMAWLSPVDGGHEQDVHVVWGRDCDDGSLLLDILSHESLPPVDYPATLTLRLQEKPSLPPLTGKVVQHFEDSATAPPRARLMIPEPPVQLLELLIPGAVLASDVSLTDMIRA